MEGGEREGSGGEGQQEGAQGDQGAAGWSGMLPGVDGGAIDPAEGGEERREDGEVVVSISGGGPGWNGAGAGKHDADDQLAGKAEPPEGQMDGGEIGEDDGKDPGVFAARDRGHARDDEPHQSYGSEGCGDEKGAAMASVKQVALAEIVAVGSGTAIEEAVGDVDQPGAEAEDGEGAPGG